VANGRLVTALLMLILLVGTAACSEPKIGGRISTGPSSPGSNTLASDSPTSTAPAPEPTPVQKLGPAPADLHDVRWSSATLPGDFCDIDGLVKFKKRRAIAKSTTWGKVHVEVWPKDIQYGDLDGDGQAEAAVDVDCNTGGGTAGDLIQSAYIVVRAADGFLVPVGTITPKQQLADGPATRLKKARFGRNRITVRELFYRASDPNCCASGEANTTWTLRDNRLVPGPPVVVS
jgi:hypothetical protein